jgi:hypothetical protein
VIEGLAFDVSSEELEEHLQKRMKHHVDKASFYAGQVAALRGGGVGAQSATNDPVSSLENSQRQHEGRMALFAFMAEHVVPDEVYRLSEQDLARIEIIARYL